MAKNGNLQEVIQAWNRGWDEPYTTPNGSLYHEDGILFSWGSHFPLAIHAVAGYTIVNGDRYSNSTAKHQSYTFREIPFSRRVEIPFSALERVLNGGQHGNVRHGYAFDPKEIEKIIVIDNMGDTWIDTGRVKENGDPIETHVLGACVFEYDDRYFFSGMDETGLGVHQYFLTELTGRVESVAEGLELMKPQAVKDAEAQGQEVERQGEWFFTECDEEMQLVLDNEEYEKNYYLKGADGDTGHHFATKGMTYMNDEQFVVGIVKHEERQHKQLKLYEVGTKPKDRKWYKAHHNIQVQSYTADGLVD